MNPTPQQLAASQSDNPLTFVVAGPGAGKTRTLLWRIEHLIESNAIEPDQIVALTYTNAAAREIQHRLGTSIRLGFIGTLHSFVLRLLRQHAAIIGYKPTINVLDEEEFESFLGNIASDHKWIGTNLELVAAIALGPPPANERLSKARLVAAAYYKALKAANLMTFDAILIFGVVICRHLKANNLPPFTCFLIDEVQDSSDLDFQIYGALVGDRYFTGDPDQSIFSFRGGDVAHCLKLANVARVHLLEDNFRCGEHICAAAQRLIEHNKARYPKATRSATGFPGEVSVRSFPDPSVEAAGIANLIATSTTDRQEIAVLLRTNDLVQEYANSLRAVGIQVAERIVKPRPEDFWKAKLLLAFLNNPDDDYVAEKWLRANVHFTPQQMGEAITAARNNFKTINQFVFHVAVPFPIRLLPKELQGASISSESQSLIMDLLRDLPDDVTIADLILSIGSQAEGEEIGRGVTVTTIHAAKGREWSMVILPAFEQGIVPIVSKRVTLEEERRLAYVAMTRAKHSLVLTHSLLRVTNDDRARMKRAPGFRATPAPTIRSQFLAEAGL